MLYFKEDIPNKDSKLIYIYQGTTVAQMQSEIEALMLSLGYKHLGQGLFEKGSRAMRLLFGAFCKYFKFRVVVEDNSNGEVKVTVSKDTTGLSGGAIGVNQVKKEFYNLSQAFRTI
ncbi:hypothetical protein JGH11_19255 [Dysgonomonas sp. Marseille-P4677]|uniref:hypothetical protein n=1 Tax=Dysgonomonas sp. Marseille-P4677 TaxID=2364790 RepID=UPI0019127FDA|nr:hypothetical protein [Dysgonomonas sp. Marseille-P4677]MBK5723010.1 hypothetical protein [Dysgonomonas sp. Marseille-P4677]